MTTSRAWVAVVGGGISGAACLAMLTDHGIDAELIDRGRVPGGRMASPDLHGRPVDIGAAYFTVRDEGFAAVVDGWEARGLARQWTSKLDVIGGEGWTSTSGALRWASTGGLRSLVRELSPTESPRAGETARTIHGREIQDLRELDHDVVVLAMPDPQAARLAGDVVQWVDYEPVIAVVAGFEARSWWMADAAFVNDDPDITLIADDGARRGDGAAVLVIHTSAQLAREHLADPEAAVAPAVAAARRVLDVTATPSWTFAHRWTFAKPAGTHGDAPFGLLERDGRALGICSDSWCPQGAPRVEAAWLAGTRLGAELARRLR